LDIGEMRNAYKISDGKSEGNVRDMSIAIKWMVKK
jgi:hypothetical protein